MKINLSVEEIDELLVALKMDDGEKVPALEDKLLLSKDIQVKIEAFIKASEDLIAVSSFWESPSEGALYPNHYGKLSTLLRDLYPYLKNKSLKLIDR